jgi:hypothetical protein
MPVLQLEILFLGKKPGFLEKEKLPAISGLSGKARWICGLTFLASPLLKKTPSKIKNR